MRKALQIIALALVPLSASCSLAPSEASGSAAREESSLERKLGDLLAVRGYEPLEFSRMTTGHLILAVELDGSGPRRFVCDTGASGTFIVPEVAKELGLAVEDSSETGGGLGGGGMQIQSTEVDRLVVDGVEFSDRSVLIIDLSHINQQFSAVGEQPIDGIIGADWLDRNRAILDFKTDTLYVDRSELKESR